MTPESIAAQIKGLSPPSMGRAVFAAVGSYQRLREVDEHLAVLGVPPSIALGHGLLCRHPELERSERMERDLAQKLRGDLQKEYEALYADHFTEHDLLVVRDFELLVRFGVDLGSIRGAATNGKMAVYLVPGRLEGGKVLAYASEDVEGYPLFDLELSHVWEVL